MHFCIIFYYILHSFELSKDITHNNCSLYFDIIVQADANYSIDRYDSLHESVAYEFVCLFLT